MQKPNARPNARTNAYLKGALIPKPRVSPREHSTPNSRGQISFPAGAQCRTSSSQGKCARGAQSIFGGLAEVQGARRRVPARLVGHRQPIVFATMRSSIFTSAAEACIDASAMVAAAAVITLRMIHAPSWHETPPLRI